MPIDPSQVTWDAAPAIDVNQIQWDQPAPAPKDTGLLGAIRGGVEAGAGLATSAVTAPVVELAKIYGTLSSGKYGTQEGIRAGEEFGEKFRQEHFYQPRTEEGKRYLQAIGEWLGSTGIQGVPYGTLVDLQRAGATAMSARPTAAQKTWAKMEQKSAEGFARGPQIEAAADAQRLNLSIPPSQIQPSLAVRAQEQIAGTNLAPKLSAANVKQVRKVALRELDLPETAQLNLPKKGGLDPFDQARAKLAGPYDEVKGLPTIAADQSIIDALNGLRPAARVIGKEAINKKINKFIDQAIADVSAGMDGRTILENVRSLRKDAQLAYKSTDPKPWDIARADTQLAIANQLETLIDKGITDPRLLARFRDARQKMARTYAYEAATDRNTGVVDILKIARQTAKDNNLTGDIAAMGRVAGNFPEAFEPVSTMPMGTPTVSRSGALGATGAVMGAPGGIRGSILGGITGGISERLGSRAFARRLASPEYQSKLNLYDPRLIDEPFVATPQNALVPIPPEVLMPGQGPQFAQPYQPNWTFGRGTARPIDETTVMMPRQRALPAPEAGAQINALRAEEARRTGMARTMEQQGMAAEAAAPRLPTAGEVILDIDPITGRLLPASRGIKGATPETFSNFGAALETAANKVTAGQRFSLTAAEKVAWDKTKVDLAEVAPGMKALTDKAVAEKMLDRAWVEQTAVKAREKAAAFEQLAARAANERARQTAIANRERMLGLAEQMEESLSQPRPVSGTQQGPKTRAQRNALAPPRIILNNMAPDRP